MRVREFRHNIALYLFLGFVLFLPYLRFSVPVPPFRLSVSDSLLLLSLLFLPLRFRRQHLVFIGAVLLFVVSQFFSFPMVLNWPAFIAMMLPWVFGLILSLVVAAVFTRYAPERIFKSIFYIFTANAFVSMIPPYAKFLLGIGFPTLYGNGTGEITWRYNFAMNNPNQFSVYTCCTLMLMVLIALKFNPKWLRITGITGALLLIPLLDSGSRSGLLCYLCIMCTILWSILIYSTLRGKLATSVLLTGLLSWIAGNLEQLQQVSGEYYRALSILDTFTQKGPKINLGNSVGTSGRSHEIGWQLFEQYPLSGVGLGQVFRNYMEIEIHSGFLSTLAETGMVGSIGFALMLGSVFFYIFKTRGAAYFKSLAVLFFSLILVINYGHMLFRERWVWLLLAGMIMISLQHVRHRRLT